MKLSTVERCVIAVAAFLQMVGLASADACSPEEFLGWYGQGEESAWVYPAANGAIGLFVASTQRQFSLDEHSQDSITETRFENGWQLTSVGDSCSEGHALLTGPAQDSRPEWARISDPYDVQEVNFQVGGVSLAGITLTPESVRGTIVIVHGHGTSDRDSGPYLAIADALARRKFAVLLPDKRGSGESEGDWREVGFDVLADDAIAGLRATNRPDVPGGLLTVSQGGWIGPLAATKAADEVRFVVNLVGPAVTLNQQQEHLMAALVAQHGFDQSTAQKLHATRAAALQYSSRENDRNWNRYLEARNELVESSAASLAVSFPDNRDDWNWDWGKRVLHIDPIEAMERSGKPYLVVYGSEDTNVAVAPNTARLVESDANATLLVLNGRGHSLANPASGVIDELVFGAIDLWISMQVTSDQ